MRRLVGYQHFLRIAERLRWDEAGIELAEDRGRWPQLAPEARERITAFVAGFAIAEERVAVDLAPFIRAAPDPVAAECFRAQAVDEERHAAFFDRYAREVLGIAGATREDRLAALRDRVEPRFAALFEERLASVAGGLAAGAVSLADAVALYHLVLEGVLFTAGQSALKAELGNGTALPGLHEGLTRVMADERWHIGLGVRVLSEASRRDEGAMVEAEAAAEAWGELLDQDRRDAALSLHRRRLAAAWLG